MVARHYTLKTDWSRLMLCFLICASATAFAAYLCATEDQSITINGLIHLEES